MHQNAKHHRTATTWCSVLSVTYNSVYSAAQISSNCRTAVKNVLERMCEEAVVACYNNIRTKGLRKT
jgi:hypothetical protein